MVIGFLDGIAFWIRELRRADGRSYELIRVEELRAQRCLKYFEANVASLNTLPNFTNVALSSALELMNFGRLMPEWDVAHRALQDWLAVLSRRPSMMATQPAISTQCGPSHRQAD